MTRKRRNTLAGLLLGIARSESRETIDAVAHHLLRDDGWSERYSHEYLTRELLPELIERLRPRPEIEYARELVDALIAGYDSYATIQVVRRPVMNLTVAADGLEVGDHMLRMIDEAAILDAEAQLRQIVTSPPNEPGAADHLCETLREQLGKQMGRAVAEIRVRSRKEIALERVQQRYDELIDFLNGAATILYPLNDRIRVAPAGELISEIETVLIISDPVEGLSMPMKWVGPRYPLDLSGLAVSKLRDSGFWGFADVLATEPNQRTEFETAMLLALHWYANHPMHATPANQLLSLTIAAETIFPRRRGGIGVGCAEGIAFVLADDPEDRYKIRETFGNLYSKRGDIAQQGQARVSERDIAVLANLVMGLLLKAVAARSEFATRDDFERWIDSRRLA
jgi:hypothetical protein